MGTLDRAAHVLYRLPLPSMYILFQNTQGSLHVGDMPWPLPRATTQARLVGVMTNIRGKKGLSASAPSVAPGSGYTAIHLPLTLGTLTSCLRTSHCSSFLSPHIWHKSAPPPVCPCLWFPGPELAGTAAAPTAGAGAGGRGNCGWGLPTPTEAPQPGAAVAWGREGGGLSLWAGFLGAWLTPTFLCTHTATPCLDGRPCANGGRCTQLPSREAACL